LNAAYQRLEQLNLELARARRQAERARRLKSEFAAAISHELRTPLNLIIAFSEMMVSEPRAYGGQILPDAYRGDVEAIYRNACHLSNLVDDVLDLSQIDADRMALQKERVHLAPIVDEAAAIVARLFAAKGLALQLAVPLDLPLVNADRTRLRQVLINLLNNAARFTSGGGVTVRARVQGADVVIAVEDTGIGIAPEHLATVFEEFRQVHVLGERRVVGSGLGLAVSKRFVELHGGSMWVESRLGQGSTFYFSVPSCENVIAVAGYPVDPRLVLASPSSGRAEPIVLVIDHQGEAGRLFQRYLDGFRVVVAESSEGARRIAAENPVQAAVLVSDHGPPDWNVLRHVGELLPGIPVAICALRGRKLTARDLGVAECLLKPISREQVRRALRRLGRHVRTVLVVDDDPEMVHLLARLITLSSRHYIAWEARSGAEALALLETSRPDALFVDLVMPEMSGDELLRRVRARPGLEELPVVLVTGHGIEDEAVTSEFLGVIQSGGFSVRESLRWLRSSLEAVHRPQTTLLKHLEQLGPADGLGQEVGCPHREGEGPLVDDGADGDRNVARRRIAGQDLQEVPAVANGHHQVERD
jgi:CheY-like chemotaxis protein/nitrogen-specific signal transduction histidine kinase